MSSGSILSIFNKDSDERLYLKNENFNDLEFSDFTISSRIKHSIEISDVRFERCRILNGVCRMRDGTSLKNVVFSELKCKELWISSEARMENVKIIGNHNPKSIIIRPQDESKESVNLEGNSLDISEYQGEVEITGIKSSDVIYNPQTQFVITADLVEKVDWKGLGISSFSIWRISARKVAAAKCVEGIFDMPNKKDEDYDTDMRELEILKKEGYIK